MPRLLEISLKTITDIFDLVKTIDGDAIPFVISILIPAFYITFKKLSNIEKPQENQNWFDKFILFISPPKVESWVLIISTLLFIIGIFQLKKGLNQKEEIRMLGIRVKNYYLNENAYSYTTTFVAEQLNEDTTKIKLLPQFAPSEFIIVPSLNIDTIKTSNNIDSIVKKEARMLLLTDSATVSRIILRSEELLNSYLSDTINLLVGKYYTFQQLFEINNFFTRQVIEELIINSNGKYVLIGNRNTGFGIKKLK